MSGPGTLPVVAEVVRSGFTEGRHHGAVVALRPDGGIAFAIGDVGAPVFPRSSNKPMQAVAVLRAGVDLPPDLLALVAASHSGEPVHVEGVRRILAGAGVHESVLQNTPDLPLDVESAHALLRAGGKPDPLHQNCSGKHAGMLAACVCAGWPVADYRDADHPLQRLVREVVEEAAGETVGATGVDGCGAPLFAISLAGLARAFRWLVLAPAGTPQRRVADAMRAHPELVGGTGRDVTALMAGLPGCVAKDGAEGVYAAAMPDGSAVAVKIADGASRARVPVMVAALRRLGVDAPVLAELAETPVLGHGRPVGAVRATLPG
ncbi:MAG: asparaginase [Frankiaceae bacterium]